MICGSNTLYKNGENAICMECGYIINDYKRMEFELGPEEFKKFENGLYKYNHKEKK